MLCTNQKQSYFIEKKVYRIDIEFEWQRFQKWYIIGHYFFVFEIKFMHYDRIDMVVAEQIIWNDYDYYTPGTHETANSLS